MPPRKSEGSRGTGAFSSSSTTTSASTTASKNLNKFAALFLDSDGDETDATEQEQHEDNTPESSAPKKKDEKIEKDEKEEARSLERPSSISSTTTPPPPPPPPLLRRPLFFLDLEMTGLDPEHDSILEIAVIATDGDDLDKRVVGPSVAITTPSDKLEKMNAWCVDHHGRSGLTARCLDPGRSVPHEEAERMVCEFVERHRPPPRERRGKRKEGGGGGDDDNDNHDDDDDDDDVVDEASTNGKRSPPPPQLVQDRAILAGNSVHTDLAFVRRHMPRLAALCSYRLVDVSCLAELARRWSPAAFYSAPEKRNAHEALKDVEDSIEELKYYRKVLFKSGSEVSRAVAKWGGPRRGG